MITRYLFLILQIVLSYTSLIGQHFCADKHAHGMFTNNLSMSSVFSKEFSKYDLHSIHLDLQVSNVNTFIAGEANVFGKAMQPLDTILLQLHDSMKVNAVYIGGTPGSGCTFIHQAHFLKVIPPNPLAAGSNFIIRVQYQGHPNRTPGNSANGNGVNNGYSQTYGNQVTWTLSQPYAAFEWWPCKQVLSDKLDSVKISLTVDDTLTATANGLLSHVTRPSSGKKTFHWMHRSPINYYLLSFCVSKYYDYSFYVQVDGLPLPVKIQNFLYDSLRVLGDQKAVIDETASMLQVFSKRFGHYPYHREKYGHTMAPMGSGMEHQTNSTMYAFNSSLTAHELAHQWWGNLVTCKSWSDIFINESFATYSEYLYVEEALPSSKLPTLDFFHLIASFNENESIYRTDTTDVSKVFDGSISYFKGACVIHQLRHYLHNDSLFFITLRDFLYTHSNSTAGIKELQLIFEKNFGTSLEHFFNQWIYQPGYPSIDMEYVQIGGDLYIDLRQQNVSQSGSNAFNFNLDLLVRFSDQSDTLIQFATNTPWNRKTFIIGNKMVDTLIIDPDLYLLKKINSVKENRNLLSFGSGGWQPTFIQCIPNPAEEMIRIVFNEENSEIWDTEIFDANGKRVYHQILHPSNMNISVAGLSPGIYWLKISGNNNSSISKFAKL